MEISWDVFGSVTLAKYSCSDFQIACRSKDINTNNKCTTYVHTHNHLGTILIAIRELLETRFESFVYLCSQLTFELNIKTNIPYFLFVKMTTVIYWTSRVLKITKEKEE